MRVSVVLFRERRYFGLNPWAQETIHGLNGDGIPQVKNTISVRMSEKQLVI